MFQQIEQLRKNNEDPQKMLSNLTSKYTPEQMEQFRNFVKGYGITDEQLSKYGINTK